MPDFRWCINEGDSDARYLFVVAKFPCPVYTWAGAAVAIGVGVFAPLLANTCLDRAKGRGSPTADCGNAV